MMGAMLKGKIAMILDERRAAVNLAADSGVAVGDVFIVYNEGAEVTDPDSGESLGRIEVVKAQVTVSHVQEKLCIVERPVEAEPEPDQSDVLSARMARVDQYKQASKRTQPIKVGDLARRL